MKSLFIKITSLVLAVVCLCAGGVGVYADDGIMPAYAATYDYDFGLAIEPGYARFTVNYLADSDLFDHAEWEMTLQKKGLIFWGDVDILISEMWFYESSKDYTLRQAIPDASGQYRATFVLRIVTTDGRVDTLSGVEFYTY
ncbi:MAG: hypothetical protein IJE84_05080 [Clostridia bacterium]|nr:hypothetical protein [Clostridia bacterium]